jgi:hypothetical protein
MRKEKYLITFCYFETFNSKINLKYFLKKGLIKSDEVFFIFIIKGLLSINIPEYENVKIIKTDNEGYDFGGYTVALNYVNINDYDFFIFLNDSVRGPFIPLYCDDPWYKYFTSKLSNDIILSGSTINSKVNDPKNYIQCKHIQSSSFCLNKKGIQLLNEENFFDKEKLLSYDIKNKKSEKIRLINDYEIGMSKIILDNNYKIQSLLLSEYKGLKNGDIQYNLRYYDDTLNPFETIFIKTNRMKNKTIENYTFFFTNLFDNKLSFYQNYKFGYKSKKKKLILFIFFGLIFINYFFINNPLINTINIFENYFHFYKIRYFF